MQFEFLYQMKRKDFMVIVMGMNKMVHLQGMSVFYLTKVEVLDINMGAVFLNFGTSDIPLGQDLLGQVMERTACTG